MHTHREDRVVGDILGVTTGVHLKRMAMNHTDVFDDLFLSLS